VDLNGSSILYGMKIAILSDIHGNTIALDAVLADTQAHKVDAYWILGDLVLDGPDPVGALQRLSALPNSRFIRGNTDRYVTNGDRPPPHPHEIGQDRARLDLFGEITGTIAWTQGAITVTGWFEWLASLPLERHENLPDGSRCLLVHASPGKDESAGVRQDTSEDDIQRLFQGCEADLICVGHTHQPVYRKIGRWQILNPGCVSLAPPAFPQASYALLKASPRGYQVAHRTVPYDQEKVISQVQAIHHPGAKYILDHLR